MSVTLPLFPLHTVLFPGGALALRIFEPRYLAMVARCLRGTNRFGVVAIRAGSEVGTAETFAVGTAAEIVDWSQEPDGLLGLRAVGRESFTTLRAWREPDGLYVGEVETLAPLPPTPLPADHRRLAERLRALEEHAGRAAEAAAYADGCWVGERLAELMPLPLPEKQALLELRDPVARLARLAAALDRPPPHAS